MTPGDSWNEGKTDVYVPTVRVQLIQTVKLRPEKSVVEEVRLVGNGVGGEVPRCTAKLGGNAARVRRAAGCENWSTDYQFTRQTSADGVAQVLISNSHSLTHSVLERTEIGQVVPVEIVEPVGEQPQVYSVTGGVTGSESDNHRRITLLQHQLHDILEHERTQLVTLLERYNHAFSLADGERGETEPTDSRDSRDSRDYQRL